MEFPHLQPHESQNNVHAMGLLLGLGEEHHVVCEGSRQQSWQGGENECLHKMAAGKGTDAVLAPGELIFQNQDRKALSILPSNQNPESKPFQSPRRLKGGGGDRARKALPPQKKSIQKKLESVTKTPMIQGTKIPKPGVWTQMSDDSLGECLV